MRPNLVDSAGGEHAAPRPYDRHVTTPASTRRPAAYRPLRLLATTLAVIAVIALGIVAGRWQWDRYDVRHDAVQAQQRAEGLPVVDVRELVSVGDEDAGDAQWREASATGTLDPDAVLEIRGRSIDRAASIQYVTWLHMDDGSAVLVNLGWQPRADATSPTLPDGPVTVTGIVRALEPVNDRPGTRITPEHMVAPGADVIPAYLMARSACGESGCVGNVEPVPEPSLSLGPHMSYAFQWWLLAVAAAPIAIALTRRDARLERERARDAGGDDIQPADDAPAPASRSKASPASASPLPASPSPEKKKARRWLDRHDGPSDEEIEDAL